MSEQTGPAEDRITDTRPPWDPRAFWPLAILSGFGAAGVLAGLNYRRLGRPELTWPTIAITVGAFAVLLVALGFLVGELGANAWLPYAVNIPPAFLLERLQRSDYETWKERFPSAGGAGWGLPVMIGAGSLAIVLAVLFIPLLVFGGISEAEERYNAGVELSEAGRWQEAIAEYDKAIELDPNLVEAYVNRGTTFNELGAYDSAIADLDKAIDLDPSSDEAYNNRGIVYVGLGQYQEAIADFDKAIDLAPNDWQSYFGRGITYADLGNIEQAIIDLEKALSLTDDPLIIVELQGLIGELRGQ